MNALLILMMILVIILLGAVCVLIYQVHARQDQIVFSQEQLEDWLSEASGLTREGNTSLTQLLARVNTLSDVSRRSEVMTEDISEQVRSITSVMTNAKRRGSWGEYQLETLVRTYLGDSTQVFETQYHLENGKIADGAFHLPQSELVLCIDSKFPMENFLRMSEEPEESDVYEKEFRRDLKKHINDVSEKYITPQTLEEAILFIPSEAVYYYLCAEGSDLMNYAISRHVMLVSPTTMAGVVFSLLASTRNFYRAENFAQIEKRIRALEQEVARNQEAVDKALGSARSQVSHLERLSMRTQRLKDAMDRLSADSARNDKI